jgi:hypothetical protein
MENNESALTFTLPATFRWFSLLSGKPSIANIQFSHIIECWAGAPPDVLNENMNNDLTFLTLAIENDFEERRLTFMFESMETRDEVLMGIRYILSSVVDSVLYSAVLLVYLAMI